MIYYGLEWHSLDTYFQFKELGSAPGTPPTNEVRVYAKDKSGTSALYLKDDAGVEREIGVVNAVTGTGTANRLAYWTSSSVIAANAALTSTRIPFADSNGLLADSARLVWDNTNFALTVKSDASVLRGFVAEHYQSGGQGPLIAGRAASGTFASPGATAADQVLLDINGQGYVSAFTGGRALIRFSAAQTFNATNQGSYMGLYTTPLNSTTIAERFRIGPSGQWGIGGATYGSSGNLFRSNGASAAPSWQDHTLDFLSQYALLAGRSGGQTLTGGTAASNNLSLLSTSHGTLGSVYLNSRLRLSAAGLLLKNTDILAGTTAPSALLHVITDNGSVSVVQFDSTDGGVNGPIFSSYQNSPSPAANDNAFTFNIYANDSGANQRQTHGWINRYVDPTITSQDSDMVFAVMDNVNGGSVNTFASLSSLGAWTDASMEIGKKFEGKPLSIWPDFWERLKALRIERYHSSRVPVEKLNKAARHISCSAEDLELQFGLAHKFLHPVTRVPLMGIAPKDLAGLALAGLQDLIVRVETLEKVTNVKDNE